jgi:hypothetical protein
MQKAWHQNELFIQAFNLPASENQAGLKYKPTTRLELGGLINRKNVALRNIRLLCRLYPPDFDTCNRLIAEFFFGG